MKNNSKIIYILTIFLIIFCTFNLIVSYSAETYGSQQQVGEDWDVTESFEPDKWTPMENSTGGDSKLIDVGNKILGPVQIIGSLISVITIIFIGIKYMLGSVEEKAQYKETLIPYVIGSFFVFGIVNIISIIYNIAKSL